MTISRRCGLAALYMLSIIFDAQSARANTYCVHTSFELQAALNDAGTGGNANDRSNTIHLVGGLFAAAGTEFSFSTKTGLELTVDGGYDVACATQNLSPGASILDGGKLSQVLSIQTNGTIDIRHLTIQNGVHDGSAGGGAQVYLSDPAATLIFDDNIVRNNSSAYASGGFTVFGSGTVHIDNNLFVGNTAPAAAALSTGMDSMSTIYFTGNTITANTNTESDNMITAIGDGFATAYVSNTISYGNSGNGAYDFYLYGFQTTQFTNNDYGSINGVPTDSSSGNFNVDPRFVGVENYHLAATSPLLNAGTLSPPGNLSAEDIEGHARVFAGMTDIGAFQHGDVIFTDGFGN